MAVTLSAQSSLGSGTANPLTNASLTVNGGDSCLLLWVWNISADRNPSGTPTWAAQNFTLIGTVSTPTTARRALFYGLGSPTAGNQTISIPNANGDALANYAVSFTGSGTTFATAFGTTASNTGTSTTASATITTGLNDLIGATFAEIGNDTLVPTSAALLSTQNLGNFVVAASDPAGGVNVTVSATVGNADPWAVLLVDILAFVANVPLDLMGQQCQ